MYNFWSDRSLAIRGLFLISCIGVFVMIQCATMAFGGLLVSVHISSLLLCYRLLRTVYCIYSNLLRYRLTPQYRVDYCTSLRQCHLTLLSQLLLSLKLLSQLHSCRSLIVRVKRYSYRFVLQSFQPIDIIRSYRAHRHVLYKLVLSQH
jgi:hypothetical protein